MLLGVLSLLAACGGSADDDLREPPDFVFQVTSGTLSTTARPNRTTELPFNPEILVELIFEEPVFGSGGQSSVRVTTDPTFWRVEPRPLRRPDDNTYPFAITNRTPGTVVVTVQVDAETEPVDFTLQIGDEDEE
jgi:hypothetical protein